MAQPATNPKIEELRFRLKTDPKSRLFFPLAEELRKAGQHTEAEQVLRTGLGVHATYLSAWVSLGRVLRDQKKDGEAVEVLNKALLLDPGNMVAARILADAYLALGEKVEAIKKYKLVLALLPSDEDLEKLIERLDREINPPADAPPLPPPAPPPTSGSAWDDTVVPFAHPLVQSAPPPPPPVVAPAPPVTLEPTEEVPFPPLPTIERPFGDLLNELSSDSRAQATGDSEPMLVAHEESPFEEPVAGYTVSSMTVESPLGMHIASAPITADVPAPVIEDEDLPLLDDPLVTSEEEESDVFALSDGEMPADDLANTITMGDLYVRQGLRDDARLIYESILLRDPGNRAVREKLELLSSPKKEASPVEPERQQKIRKLESWLAKMNRGGAAGV